MKKILLKILIAILLLLGALILFSPYKNNVSTGYKCITVSIEIAKPPAAVFSYLGNSGNASIWSVYVDHIITLNANKVPDGAVGSTRRCFKEKDETGIVWDEDITEVIPNVKRQISIYNEKGFPMITEGLMTEQIYKSINDSTTLLTFTLFNKNRNLGWVPSLKTHIASYVVAHIFKKNLVNIKHYVEHGNPQ